MALIVYYLIGMIVVLALVFAVVWFVFGRGEEIAPIPRGETLTRLPSEGITGNDVRVLVFQQRLRGYQASEVDWALEKLAREIDELRALVHDLEARDAAQAAAGAPAARQPEG